MIKKLFYVFLIFVPLISAEWKLTWSDEFNGDSLDRSKWDVEINCWGGGNLEKQCYVDRPQNIYVRDGALHLRPIAGTYQGSERNCTLNNENSCTWTQPSTSGRIRTLRSNDGHFLYGKFEVRAKLPKGDFLWPAIWLLPTDNEYGQWAASGEIDIMEFRGQDRNKVSHALHFGGLWPNNRYSSSGDLSFGFDFTEDFHVFGLEWSPDEMKFTVDGKVTHIESLRRSFGNIYNRNGQPFDKRFHMILNCAVAGNFFDTNKYGHFDINRAAPTWTQPFIIDYVRVYKWDDSPSPAPVQPPQSSPSPVPSEGHTIPLIPVADGFVDSTKPDQSFGKDSTLMIKKDGNNVRSGYLKFYVPNISSSSATLLLYGGMENPKSNVSVSIYGISNDWSENSLTHKNKPERGSKIATARVSNKLGWYEFNITDYVSERINDDINIISIQVDMEGEGSALFNSAQSEMNQPILRICL